MALTINIHYTGKGTDARDFAREMVESGTVALNKGVEGNLRYDYYLPMGDEHTVLLIDSWVDQKAIDRHHDSPMMKTIMELREKYNLRMKVERYVSDEAGIPQKDASFIRS